METKVLERIDSLGDDLRGTIQLRKFAQTARVRETITTSDLAFIADVIDRGVKSGYLNEAVPAIYDTIGWRRDQRTFETAIDYEINAAKLIDRVPEKGEYPVMDPTISHYDFHVGKYGCQFDVSWEAWLRDGRDLGLLAGYPESWGLSARYTKAYLWALLYASNATLFTVPKGNLMSAVDFITGTADLTPANLGEAITRLRSFTDPSGNVAVYAGPIYLVVPPSLEFIARAVVGSPVLTTGANIILPTSNPLYGAANMVMDPFLPAVDPVNGTTAWYLFAAPALRPALRYGYVTGYEEPEVFVRESAARALMGGASDPFDGSFATDDIEFKLRFTWGCGLVDWRGALMVANPALY
jgi:hypothetical protein